MCVCGANMAVLHNNRLIRNYDGGLSILLSGESKMVCYRKSLCTDFART